MVRLSRPRNAAVTAPAPRTPTPLLNIAKPDADRLITAAAQGDPSAIEFWVTLFQKHTVPSTDPEQPTLFYCWFCDRETTAPMPTLCRIMMTHSVYGRWRRPAKRVGRFQIWSNPSKVFAF